MTAQQTDSEPESKTEQNESTDTVHVQTHPTIKPTLLRLGTVVVVGLALVGYLQTRPELLGSPAITDTAALVIGLGTLFLVIRFAVRLAILRNTTYVVTEDRIEQRYELLFRVYSKGVRFDKLRSHELDQNRVQSLLDIGTISLNRGLGPLRLQNIEDPDEVYRTIRQCTTRSE